MSSITVGKYYKVNSKIHTMNPVSKIMCTIIFLITLAINNNYLVITLTILTFLGMILSKVPLRLYFKSITSLKVLIIFMIVITIIFQTSLLSLVITIVKIVLAVLYTMILTFTTSKNEMVYGFRKLLKPLRHIKVPVEKIALSLTLAFRFIPLIFEQTEKVMKSQASRGIDFKYQNLKGKITAISSMILPMFILSSKRADGLAEAMEMRLYDYKKPRTNYFVHKWTHFDDDAIVIHLGIILFFALRMIV